MSADTRDEALRAALVKMVKAACFLRDRVIETRGVKCMDDMDAAITEAEAALAASVAPASTPVESFCAGCDAAIDKAMNWPAPPAGAVEDAAERVRRFVAAWDSKPMRGRDPEFYSLHVGELQEASLHIDDLRTIATLATPAARQGGEADALRSLLRDMDEQAAACEMGNYECSIVVLRQFRDRLDTITATRAARPAAGDGEAVAWSLRFIRPDGTPGPVNAMTTYSTEEDANAYADRCATDYAPRPGGRGSVEIPAPHKRPVVVPLYTAPPAREGVPEDVRHAVMNGDLYATLTDVQNGIDSPALVGMANRAIRLIDKAREVLAAAPTAGEGSKDAL